MLMKNEELPKSLKPIVSKLKKFGITGFVASFMLLGGLGMSWDGYFGGTYTEEQYHTFEGPAVRDLGTVRLPDKHGEYDEEQRASLRSSGLFFLVIGSVMLAWKISKMRANAN